MGKIQNEQPIKESESQFCADIFYGQSRHSATGRDQMSASAIINFSTVQDLVPRKIA